MPLTLIKWPYQTQSKPKTQINKTGKQTESTSLLPNLQTFEQKLVSGNGFLNECRRFPFNGWDNIR